MMHEQEASRYLGRSKNYLRDRRMYKRSHPPFKQIGVKRYYRLDDLKAWKHGMNYIPVGLYDEQSASVYLGHDLNYINFRRCKGRHTPPHIDYQGRRFYKDIDLDEWKKAYERARCAEPNTDRSCENRDVAASK